MKAVAVSPATRHVGLANIDEPIPAQRHRGVCGTDKEICRFDYGTPPSGSEDAGPDVMRVKQGDLVAVMVCRPCYQEACSPCHAGRPFPEAIGNLISKRRQMAEHEGLLLGRAGGIKNVISLE